MGELAIAFGCFQCHECTVRAKTKIQFRACILPETHRKLITVANKLGLSHNPFGRLLDVCVDMMEVTALTLNPSEQRGRGYRLSDETVRIIRESTDKAISVAVFHGISRSTVSRIRCRLIYKSVR